MQGEQGVLTKNSAGQEDHVENEVDQATTSRYPSLGCQILTLNTQHTTLHLKIIASLQ